MVGTPPRSPRDTARYIVDYRKRRSTKGRIFTRICEEIDNCTGPAPPLEPPAGLA